MLAAPAGASASALAHALSLSTRLQELRVARLVLLGGGLLGANATHSSSHAVEQLRAAFIDDDVERN